MKKSLFAAATLFLAATAAHAGPFLQSDPWPLVDAVGDALPQPDSCQAVDGTVTKPLALLTDAAGKKYIKADLAGTTNGTHKFVITCKNDQWGLASAPVDFQFVAGAPTAPAGFRIVP